MKIVTQIVNFIQAKDLNHCQFQNFLCKKWDFVYHSDVHWLSHAKVLKRISKFKDTIQQFMTSDQF